MSHSTKRSRYFCWFVCGCVIGILVFFLSFSGAMSLYHEPGLHPTLEAIFSLAVGLFALLDAVVIVTAPVLLIIKKTQRGEPPSGQAVNVPTEHIAAALAVALGIPCGPFLLSLPAWIWTLFALGQ